MLSPDWRRGRARAWRASERGDAHHDDTGHYVWGDVGPDAKFSFAGRTVLGTANWTS
jgi:hypothetical protein